MTSQNYTTTNNGMQQLRIVPHVQAANPVTDLVELSLVTPNEVATTPIFKPLTRQDLRNRPKKQFIIDGLLGKSDIAMIYGAPGSGKTFVVIDLILALTTGHAFMDRYGVPQPLNVVYATNEGLDGLNQRLSASENKHMARMAGVLDATNQRLTTYEDMPQLYDRHGEFNIDTFINELIANGSRVDVLVLDTLSNAILGAEENSSNHMAIVMAGFRRACVALNCCGVLVHHTNKGGGYRGSSVLHGSMDLALEVIKDEYQAREVKVFKLKDRVKSSPNEGESFPFILQGDDVTESCYPIWDTDSERAGRKANGFNGFNGDINNIIDDNELIPHDECFNRAMKEWNMSTREARNTLSRLATSGQLTVETGGKTGKAKFYRKAKAMNENTQLLQ